MSTAPVDRPAIRKITLTIPRLRVLNAQDEPSTADDDQLVADLRARRPRTRGECRGGQRPCPWISCAHHLYLEVNRGGESITLPHGDLEVDEIPETCALDVADRGGVTLGVIARALAVTRERVRQIEERALFTMGLRNGELKAL